MRVCVTGGAGFQGSHLSRALLARGDDVTILSTLSDASVLNITRFGLQDAKVVWGSVTDPEVVHKTTRGHDIVFHLAANIHVDESRDRPVGYFQTNLLGTFNVAEECRRGNIPLFHVSTCEVYGGCNFCQQYAECRNLISEACSLKPQSPYAASKAAGDCLVYSYAQTYATPTLIVRPGNVFGPGQRGGVRGAVISRFVQQAIAREPLLVYGEGSQERSFVYVSELVRAYLFLADRFMAGSLAARPEVFNVDAGHVRSIRELAEAIVKLTSSPSPIVFGEPRPGEVSTFRLDSSRLARAGFRWTGTFEQALQEYIKDELHGTADCVL